MLYLVSFSGIQVHYLDTLLYKQTYTNSEGLLCSLFKLGLSYSILYLVSLHCVDSRNDLVSVHEVLVFSQSGFCECIEALSRCFLLCKRVKKTSLTIVQSV